MIIESLAIAQFVGGALWGVLPAFLLSVGFGVLIRALKLDGLIRQAVEARVGVAVLAATAVGAFSPLCSCTVIPVVSGLLLGGVPLAPVMAFWVASPTMDPEMFALTVATLGWPLAIVRLAATLVLSLGAGYLTLALTRSGLLGADILRLVEARKPASSPSLLVLATGPLPVTVAAASGPGRTLPIAGGSQPLTVVGGDCCSAPVIPVATSCCGSAGAGAASASEARGWVSFVARRVGEIDWPTFGRDMAVQTWRLGRWLVLAFVLEAVMIRYVPQASIAGVLGEGSWLAVPMAALVGIPLYLNNVSALPIVSGLLDQGMQPGAALAFLIAGPVTTVPAMSAVWGVVRPRVFGLYVGVALLGAVLLGALTNVLLG